MTNIFLDIETIPTQRDDVKADLARSATSKNLASGPLKPEFDVAKATFSVGGEGFLPNTLNTITTVTNTIRRSSKRNRET
jgi:hypothetical protein